MLLANESGSKLPYHDQRVIPPNQQQGRVRQPLKDCRIPLMIDDPRRVRKVAELGIGAMQVQADQNSTPVPREGEACLDRGPFRKQQQTADSLSEEPFLSLAAVSAELRIT